MENKQSMNSGKENSQETKKEQASLQIWETVQALISIAKESDIKRIRVQDIEIEFFDKKGDTVKVPMFTPGPEIKPEEEDPETNMWESFQKEHEEASIIVSLQDSGFPVEDIKRSKT